MGAGSAAPRTWSDEDEEIDLAGHRATLESMVSPGKPQQTPESREFVKHIKRLFEWRSALANIKCDVDKEDVLGSIAQDTGFAKPEVEAQLDALYSRAARAKLKLDELGTSVAAEATRLDPESDELTYVYEAVPLKPRDRAREKCRGGDPRRLGDVARGSLCAADERAVRTIVDIVFQRADVVRFKNRFRTPHFNGYRDALFSVRVDRVGVVELQVHHKLVKLRSERHGYVEPRSFYRSVTSETLDVHVYFRDFFRGGDSTSRLAVLDAIREGDRTALEDRLAVLEDKLADSNAERLKILDFLLVKLGDLDARAHVLIKLPEFEDATAKNDEQPRLELTDLIAHTGLSKAQADLLRENARAVAHPKRHLVRAALRPARSTGRLFGFLVVNLLAQVMLKGASPS